MFSLSATNFIFQFFTVGLYIFLLQFLRYKGFSLTQIGLLMAISPTISIISQPFWGDFGKIPDDQKDSRPANNLCTHFCNRIILC